MDYEVRCPKCGKLLYKVGFDEDSKTVIFIGGYIDSKCPRCHLFYRIDGRELMLKAVGGEDGGPLSP